jgi:glutamate-1-semialdehyde 2,1-aminomutase
LNKAIGTPFFAARGQGSRVWDIEGNSFIDMCCAHGAGLLGHGHPAIAEALRHATELGFLNSFETEYSEALARKVTTHIPCADKVRFCSSGTEATMHLIRACREYTGRSKIIRIEGHFHGYHEMIYIGGHPPEANWPDNRKRPYVESPGIPSELAQWIIPVAHNDLEALERIIHEHGEETALLILEPINFNSGGIKPAPGYLQRVRELTEEAGIVLFFDEIQSAFKTSLGGAQLDYGVTPDVCTIGKSFGGGLPLSAFCGKAAIMDRFQPDGPVQHSGTFNAHLIPVLCGLAFFSEAEQPAFYEHLRHLEQRFHEGIDRIIAAYDLEMVVPHYGARFDIVFGRSTPPQRYEDLFVHDRRKMLAFVRGCYEQGIYFHDYGGSPVHHGYSIQHSEDDIDKVLNVMEAVLLKLKKGA